MVQQYGLKFLNQFDLIFKKQNMIKKGLRWIALLILCWLAYKLKGPEKPQRIIKLQDLIEFDLKEGFDLKATTVIQASPEEIAQSITDPNRRSLWDLNLTSI